LRGPGPRRRGHQSWYPHSHRPPTKPWSTATESEGIGRGLPPPEARHEGAPGSRRAVGAVRLCWGGPGPGRMQERRPLRARLLARLLASQLWSWRWKGKLHRLEASTYSRSSRCSAPRPGAGRGGGSGVVGRWGSVTNHLGFILPSGFYLPFPGGHRQRSAVESKKNALRAQIQRAPTFCQ